MNIHSIRIDGSLYDICKCNGVKKIIVELEFRRMLHDEVSTERLIHPVFVECVRLCGSHLLNR